MNSIVFRLFIAFISYLGLASCLSADQYLRPANNPYALRIYNQKIKLTYPNKAVARAANLKIEPLPYGKELSVSTRWDDYYAMNFRMRNLMKKYGFKGNFYLNEPRQEHHVAELSDDTAAIGSHGQRHAGLTLQTPEYIFWELAANRAYLESACDRPVNSHAFAYGMYSRENRPDVDKCVAESIMRCGFMYESDSGFINARVGLRPSDIATGIRFTAGDRNTTIENFIAGFENSLKNPLLKSHPNITIGTHVWHRGRDWDAMEEGYAKYSKNPQWWYCTHNQYAAYRYEYHHAKVKKIKTIDSAVIFDVTRYLPAELGESVPLYFSAPGASGAVSLSGAKIELTAGRLSLAHDSDKKLPEVIDLIANKKESSILQTATKIQGLQAVLEKRGNKLIAHICLPDDVAMDDVRLTWRLSLSQDCGVVSISQEKAVPDESGEVTYTLTLKNPKINDAEYYWAEFDFNFKGKPCRLHLTCGKDLPMIGIKK